MLLHQEYAITSRICYYIQDNKLDLAFLLLEDLLEKHLLDLEDLDNNLPQ